jgi:hypothetical protein
VRIDVKGKALISKAFRDWGNNEIAENSLLKNMGAVSETRYAAPCQTPVWMFGKVWHQFRCQKKQVHKLESGE